MARIRSIKPDFFRHAGLFDAEKSSGLPLRIAFAGLWTAADREGRFHWEPRALKLDCLPFDDIDFELVLDALADHGFIVKYSVDGKEYGYIPSWHQHQHINAREAQSRIPSHESADTCTHMHTHGEGKGREGKGREEEDDANASSKIVSRRTSQSSPVESPSGLATKYAFEGHVVKLKQVNFDNWVKAFPALDLRGELTARDAWLSSDRATDDDRRNWFHSTPKYLANRNLEANAKAIALKGGPKLDLDNPKDVMRFILS